MACVTFYPKAGAGVSAEGWPLKVQGDGFIDLRLDDADLINDSAIYIDNFRETYEFFGATEGEWTVFVREDGW